MNCLILLDPCILTYKSRLPVAPQLFLLEGGSFPFLSVANASLTSPAGLQFRFRLKYMYSLVDTGTDLAWLIHMVHCQQRESFHLLCDFAVLQFIL